MAHHHIIRLPAVLTRVGLSCSAVYAAISRNDFSAPISLGAQEVGWLDSDIDAWMQPAILRLTGWAMP